MGMREIDAIIFDKDGTLFDFAGSWGGWAARVLDHIESVAPQSVDAVEKAFGFDRRSGLFNRSSVVIAGSASGPRPCAMSDNLEITSHSSGWPSASGRTGSE